MAKRSSLFFFLLAISLFGIVFQAKAQTSCYTNPSMEGPAVPHQVPLLGWHAMVRPTPNQETGALLSPPQTVIPM